MAGVSGRSGRRAKPVALKVLNGNAGKRKLNKDEPDFGLVENIDCPEWMGDYGRELWETVTPLLCSEKILQATDIQNLHAYCDAYDQFRMCVKDIKNQGITIMTESGSIVKNPSVTAKNEALRTMATYGGMLGLDPASRQRLTGGSKPSSDNPFAALLNN